jgi:hypothetical protein
MAGEPNNTHGQEHYGEINLNPDGIPGDNFGRWNDQIAIDHETLAPHTNNAIVEIPQHKGEPALSQQFHNPANGHTYVRIVEPLTFAQARARAVAMGGYLVAINDAAENAFIVKHFTPSVRNTAGCQYDWIGCSDEVDEGTWLWDSGEPCTYANWMAGEPNNTHGQEHYGEINLDPDGIPGENFGRWNDQIAIDHETLAPHTNNAIIEIPQRKLPRRGGG